MKQSHTTTPRTLEDCHFAHNANPIEMPPEKMDALEYFVVLACVVAGFICLAIVLHT